MDIYNAHFLLYVPSSAAFSPYAQKGTILSTCSVYQIAATNSEEVCYNYGD